MKKRLICFLLITVIIFSVLPTAVFAQETQKGGMLSDTIEWSYNESTGQLYISGSGAIPDFSPKTAPWIEKYQNNIYSIVVDEGITEIGQWAFAYIYYARDVKLPETLQKIGMSAFYQCASIEEVSLFGNVSEIGGGAFAYCKSLKNIFIPENITKIASYTFCDCNNLKNICYAGSISDWEAVTKAHGNDILGSVSVSSNMEPGVYWSYNSKTDILVISGNGRMDNYSAKQTPWYMFSSEIKKIVVEEGITGIGNYAFGYCGGVTEITLPRSLTYIGSGAFYKCSSVESLSLSDSITKIYSGAFYGCSRLKTINIPIGIDTVYKHTFLGCSSLAEVSYSGSAAQFDKITVLENNSALTELEIKFGRDETGSALFNVKDYGAVGDGKTDDRQAILNAFSDAVNNLPATVYFPEGEYGLLTNGLYVYMPLGASGLTVRGDGADKSVIKYLENWQTGGQWVALRIQPQSTPESLEQYLKNVTVTDLGVYDTDPVSHAWHTDKGDAETEETHGFDIQYCVNAAIKNCKVTSVGDEAIDMVFCVDSVIENNTVISSPGAGGAGGAISAGDGCDNITIINNTVDGSIEGKTNFGIAVEALNYPVSNITISGNTVKNVNGNAINIAAPNGTIDNISVIDNKISHSNVGVSVFGVGNKNNIIVKNTTVSYADTAFSLVGKNNYGFVVDGFDISNISSYAIDIKNTQDAVVKNGSMTELGYAAIFNAGYNTLFENIQIDGVGLTDNTVPAIEQSTLGGSCSAVGISIINCNSKIALRYVNKISDVTVEQPQLDGYVSIWHTAQVLGGSVNRHILGLYSGGIIDGVTVTISENMMSTPAIYLTNKNCTVKNCRITVPSGKAIAESGNSDCNQVCGNICIGGGVTKMGEGSVFSDNTIS